MTVDVRPLEELAVLDATRKLGVIHEVIGDSVLLALSGGPRSRRNRQAKARESIANARDQRSLAYA
jgi:hypothetical protein